MSNYPSSYVLALPSNGEAALNGYMTIAPVAASSGARVAFTLTGAADTGITASTEQSDAYFNGARTITFATGALTNQRSFRFAAPTLAFAGASTVTNAATLYVDAAPAAGTNATITNAYALWVDDGAARFDGAVGAGGAAPASAVLSATSTTQGFLPPRMTATQRDAIASPAAGLLVYNTTSGKLNFYNGSAWEAVTSA